MSKNILVIEDDPDILFIIELILKDEGYQVFCSADGSGIEDSVSVANPDLILMDIQLPAADGRELCKNIKRDRPEIPVILMSANMAYSKDTELSCADSFIAKPFDINHLVNQVNTYLPFSA